MDDRAPKGKTMTEALDLGKLTEEAAEWLFELSDRTSPEEYPDMGLVTAAEVAGFAADYNHRLLSRLREVEGALEPFARVAVHLPPNTESFCLTTTSPPRPDKGRFYRMNTTDFRRARAALSNSPLGEGTKP